MAAPLVAIATLSQPASAANVFNGNEYFLTNTPTTWQAAQAEAVANSGNLVAINSAAEQQFLVNTFGSASLFWIGLTDSVLEGTFSWVNGDPFTSASYANWNSSTGEPNVFGGPEEDFVLMNWQTAGGWADFPSGSKNSYRGIIERQATAVPTPALLPGLLAFGAGIVRKRKAAAA
jgi:hypothetical protein